MTNIYEVEPVAAEWEGWVGPDDMPDPRAMSHLAFECSSPDWVAEVGSLLAAGLSGPAWFVDAAGVAWPAGAVDADLVVLG